MIYFYQPQREVQMSIFNLPMQIESRIAQALIHEILVRGYTVSIHNGEEEAISHSCFEEEILESMGVTDEDTIRFFNGPTIVGGIVLFYGQGENIVSSYSRSPGTLQIVERALKIALA
jgi:hypothetical protein